MPDLHKVCIVEADGPPRGAIDVARALVGLGFECHAASSGDLRKLDAIRPDLVVNLVHPIADAAGVAALVELRGLAITGPSSAGLARLARAWRRHLPRLDVMTDMTVVEGLDIPVALIGNDPVTVIPAEVAGSELQTIEVPTYGPTDGSELAAMVRELRSAFDLRDFAQIDVRLTPSGHLWLVDIDPLPALAADGPLTSIVDRERWLHDALVARSVLEGWQRVELSARHEARA
jgi:hypothetical protein